MKLKQVSHFDLRDRVPARCHVGKFIYVRENSRT